MKSNSQNNLDDDDSSAEIKYEGGSWGAVEKSSWPASVESGISEEDKGLIAAAIDAAVDDYRKDHFVVFPSDEIRMKQKFSYERAKLKDWDRSIECMYPDCKQDSIKRSHTIPRGILKLIAEKGHLVAPRFDQINGCLVVEEIGIKQASIFPGFCAEHENIFQDFEATAQLSNPLDFALQVFRTVCREMVKTAHVLKHLEQSLAGFRKRRDNWLSSQIQKNLGKSFLLPEDFRFNSVEVRVNDVVAYGERKIREGEEGLAKLREKFFEPFARAFDSLSLETPIVHIDSSRRLPVALSGRGNFQVGHAENPSKVSNIIVIINAIPRVDGTDIFLAVPEEDEDALKFYLKSVIDKMEEEDDFLSMVESWMLNGSDHWFMAPSAWNHLSPATKDGVLDNIMSDEDNIWASPNVPVLESVREKEWGET